MKNPARPTAAPPRRSNTAVGLILVALLAFWPDSPVQAQGSSMIDVSGQIFNGGGVNMSVFTTATPQFLVVDVQSGQTVTGFTVSYDSASASYTLGNLPAAQLSITPIYFLRGSTSTLPGNYRGTLIVNGTAGFDLFQQFIDVLLIMHLTQPIDNDNITFTIGNGYPTHLQSVNFAWDPVQTANNYRIRIDLYRSPSHPLGYGRIANVVVQTVTTTSFSIQLPVSGANEIYQMTLEAQAGSVAVFRTALMYVTYTNGFDPDYRFQVAANPPNISLTAPSTVQVNTPVNLSATASNCTPDPTGWQWAVGGGLFTGPSNGDQVTVTWTTGGNKNIAVSNLLCGTASATGSVTVQAPVVTVTGPSAGLTTLTQTFTASATGCSPGTSGWQWTATGAQFLGARDGSQVDLVWANPGARTVTAMHPACGTAQGSQAITISRIGTIAAGFRAAPDSPVAGLEMRFFDESVGNVTSWDWNFGDGNTSTLRNPRHTFRAAGIYLVSLTASDGTVTGMAQRSIVVLPGGNTVELTEARFGAVEGTGEVIVTLKRGVASPATAAVDIRIREDSAKFGRDLAGPALRTVTWPPNDASPRTLTIPLIDDGATEKPERFTVSLENPRGIGLGSRRTAKVVISDDDIQVDGEDVISLLGENPVVAHSTAGLTAVAWQEPAGNGFDIFATVFGPAGGRLSGPQRINQRRAGNQVDPTIAWAGESLLVLWVDEGNSSSLTADGFIVSAALQGGNLVGAFLDPAALGTGTNVPISEPGDEAANPQIAADENGDVVVTWEDDRGPRGRVLRDNLAPVGASFSIEPSQPDADQLSTDKASTGDFVTVWRLPGRGLRGRVFNQTGKALGATFVVSGNGAASQPEVAVRGDRSMIVTWQEGGAGSRVVKARQFTPQGKTVGAAFRVGNSTAADQYSPTIDVNDAGDFAIVWIAEGSAKGSSAAKNTVGAFFSPGGDQIGNDVPVAGPQPLGDPEDPDVSVGEDDSTDVVITLRGPGGQAGGVIRRTFSPSLAGGPCERSDQVLCLQDGRFRVTAEWQDTTGRQESSGAVDMSVDTGVLWFFDEENVEVVVKVLDGCGVNGRYWVFAGGLTDVEVKLRVDDTETGISRVYTNPVRNAFQPLQDTDAFSGCSGPKPEPDPGERPWDEVPQASSQACAPGTLCLANGRFEVDVTWRLPSGSNGRGTPVPFSNDTGLFWFFDSSNLELVVKVLDGCGVNRKYWVFAGGLTDVRVDVRVTDTWTRTTVQYANPQGRAFVPVQDTSAFATCR